MIHVTIVSSHELNIRGEATVHHASKLYCSLASATLAREGSLTLDLRDLESIDVAGAQILIAFIASQHPVAVNVKGGERIRTRLEIVGLSQHLLK